MSIVEIDKNSGYCFGVVTAINKAEEALSHENKLYCLGDIVHNSDEVERLRKKGLETISHADMADLRNVKVLLRAHGEPPSTYSLARERSIDIVDATCPVVLQLQRRIRKAYEDYGANRQIVIFGKQGHAEVNGLVGQTDGHAIVVSSIEDLEKLDFSRDIELYSQTTMSLNDFAQITREIDGRMTENAKFKSHDTICRQVAHRVDGLKSFAASHSLVLFVCGLKSSNGRVLYNECKEVNPNTVLVTDISSLTPEMIRNQPSIGICGATSTPRWLMESVKEKVEQMLTEQ